eukprot:13749134-Ditylum_brightwellii.AAC.1
MVGHAGNIYPVCDWHGVLTGTLVGIWRTNEQSVPYFSWHNRSHTKLTSIYEAFTQEPKVMKHHKTKFDHEFSLATTAQFPICPTYLPPQTVPGPCRIYIDHGWAQDNIFTIFIQYKSYV